jgi:hypothetical protein
MDIWAFNITGPLGMSGYSLGFLFNNNTVEVLSVTNGSVLDPYTSADFTYIPGTIQNTGQWGGNVTVYTWSLYSTDTPYPIVAANQWVELLVVKFEVLPTLATPYVETIAGTPQPLIDFTTNPNIVANQILITDSASDDVTPYGFIANATLTYTLPPKEPPVAASVVSPNPATTGSPVTFNAITSTPGWTGTATAPIVTYYWNEQWNSSFVKVTTVPTLTITFATPGTYTLNLTVNAQLGSYNMNSTNYEPQTVLIVTPPTGCLITLYTQNWRYIDPFYIPTTFVGDQSGLVNGTEADSFRPGDLVQLFANATYNGAPVSNALVTFEVFDNQGNVVTVATATTNCYGVAEWDFRIPWPSTENLIVNNFTQGSYAPTTNQTNFGEWKVYATWQLGSQFTEEPPFEKTQAAYITFDVSWGLSVSIVSVEPNPAVRGPASCGYGSDVIVKVNVMNEYLTAIKGTLFCTIYDNLLVPIYPVAYLTETFPANTTTSYSFASIAIPSYAFVGTGYVVVNLLSTYPSLAGTAFCPTAIGTLVINAP